MSSYPPLREKGDNREYQLAPAPKEPPREALWQAYTIPPTPSSKRLPPSRRPPTPVDLPGPAWLTITALFGGAIALLFYSVQQKHYLGILATPILLFPALHGVWRGGFRKLLMIPVIMVASWWIMKAPAAYGPTVQQFLRSADVGLVNMLVAACAVPILVLGLGIVQTFRRRVIMRSGILFRIDRFLGALVGLAEGGLIMLTICWITILMAPKLREATADTQMDQYPLQKSIVEGFLKVSDEAQTGQVGEIVARTNVLDRVPTVKQKLEEWCSLALNKGTNSSTGAATGGLQLNKFVPQDGPSSIQEFEKNAKARNEQYEQIKKQLPSQNQQQP
jgi:uncharacterized membrane protein required for colicin V production